MLLVRQRMCQELFRCILGRVHGIHLHSSFHLNSSFEFGSKVKSAHIYRNYVKDMKEGRGRNRETKVRAARACVRACVRGDAVVSINSKRIEKKAMNK